MLQAILDGSVNSRLVTHVIIPETVEELEEDVFLHCTALTKITILASLKNAHSAFDKCPTLEHVHFGPKADMPFRCFENCHAWSPLINMKTSSLRIRPGPSSKISLFKIRF